ncbi:MAG: protein-tyrosine phosphatase family protein [Planctomycetota bacterium]
MRWIEGLAPGRLAVGRCPLGRHLEETVISWQQSGVHCVASLLCPSEIVELGLEREAELCAAHGMEFLAFPVPDHSVPQSMRDTRAFALRLQGLLAREKSVFVHCRAGIGRSVVIAACVMVLNGTKPEDAFARIGAARGYFDVPETNEQRNWVLEFAGRL